MRIHMISLVLIVALAGCKDEHAHDATGSPPVQTVYLSDIGLQRVQVFTNGTWGFGGNGYLGDINNTRIVVNGVESPHGLGMHSPRGGVSRVVYRLNGQYARLAGKAARHGEGQSRSPVTFVVTGDGNEIWRSQPIQDSSQSQQFDVSVMNVKLLELAVHCPGHNHGAVAVWSEPRLYR